MATTTASAASDASAAISVHGLRKRYGDRAVLDGIELEVQSGSIAALLGPNGAGKTTTVEIVEGYRTADGGEVRVLGLDPVRDGRALRSRLGLMLQGGGIYPQTTPREILRLYASFFRNPLDPEVLIEQAGLGDVATTRYRVLSGGQKQRLGLALALVGRPELAILDEPTAGMDPAAKAATRALIGGLRDGGVTVLLTTHELADVERLADHVTVIDRGRVVASGTVAELASGAAPRLRFRLSVPLAPADETALEAVLRGTIGGAHLGGTEAMEHDRGNALAADGAPGRYRIGGAAPSPAMIAALAAWCSERGLLIAELSAVGATLEERYLELTGAQAADGEATDDAAADDDATDDETADRQAAGEEASDPSARPASPAIRTGDR